MRQFGVVSSMNETVLDGSADIRHDIFSCVCPDICLHFPAMTTAEVRNQIRIARGDQSQEEFARAGGVGAKTVYRWESGESLPRSQAHIDFLVSRGVERPLITSARAAKRHASAARGHSHSAMPSVGPPAVAGAR